MPTARNFRHVKVGDTVTRNFCGKLQKMGVSAVDDKLITAGMGWQFERDTGAEYDEDIKWGSRWGATGSFLVENENEPKPA